MSLVDPNTPYSGSVDRCRACGRDFDTSRLTLNKLCERCDANAEAAREHQLEQPPEQPAEE
jgi:hypothetical protein